MTSMTRAIAAQIATQVGPGIVVGVASETAGYRLDFSDAATPEQRAAALSVLAGFDSLAVVKTNAKRTIDDEAERQRLRRITGGASKAMEYLEARDQAVAVIRMGEAAANALPNGGVSEFPVLAASVGTEAQTLYAAAQLISGRYEAYAAIAGAIKRKVIEAKAAVDAAQSEGQVQSVLGAISWP